MITQQVIDKIEKLLYCYWSPEQIFGHLGKQSLFVSHDSIYQYILRNKKEGGDLYTFLRSQRKRKEAVWNKKI